MKIKEFSIPRSGSTFIYQILKQIFGDVLLTHHYEPGIQIIVYRNFLDSVISHHRVMKYKMDNFIIHSKAELDSAIERGIEFQEQIFLFENELDGKLILSYEDDIYLPNGQNNYENVFKKIEQHFNINFDDKKEEIKQYTNYQLNKKRSGNYKNFDKYDLTTKIHGKHVVSGEIDYWKTHVVPELHAYYLTSITNGNYNKWIKMLEENGKR